jgi:hypothetical protein
MHHRRDTSNADSRKAAIALGVNHISCREAAKIVVQLQHSKTFKSRIVDLPNKAAIADPFDLSALTRGVVNQQYSGCHTTGDRPPALTGSK